MNMKIVLFSTFALVVFSEQMANETNLVRIAELEGICGAPPSCNVEDQALDPTPDVIIGKYNLTNGQIVSDLKYISGRYSQAETNAYLRGVRKQAIGWIGQYGTTNDLPFLSAIVTNRADYAQESAIMASLALLKHSPDLILFACEVATNRIFFTVDEYRSVENGLYGMCKECESDDYLDDDVQRARIAAYFLERAAKPFERPLGADHFACEMNPSYRHSQARRDNLSRNRPPNLTGRQAELYDARQRDAMGPEE